MRIRDATAEDAAALSSLADRDLDAARLVRDRAVRVAEDDGSVAGFVAFEASAGTVHVTRLDGDDDAVRTLLEEPCSFAARENLPVDVVLVEDDPLADVLLDAGFEDAGAGPRFDGDRTRRYRRVPAST